MAGTNVIVGPFVNASQMTDIALDNTGGLFGVAFDQGGSFWSINPRTGRATLAATSYSGHDIDGGLGGLASYGPGLFYASSNSGGSMPFLVEIANFVEDQRSWRPGRVRIVPDGERQVAVAIPTLDRGQGRC